MTIALRGMTWSHPRGYDPLVAASMAWKARTGVEIAWDKRSLQDFESFPVEELAARYDFIVIDHPHVGRVTAENCLLPLDGPGHAAERAAIAAGSVGPSYASYAWRGRQWALPIDAATQVQAYRPDRLGAPVKRWVELMALAEAGRVAIPLRPPHSLMVFYTLAAHSGSPCHTDAAPLIERTAGAALIERLRELVARVDSACLALDPIDVLERMAAEDFRDRLRPADLRLCPLRARGLSRAPDRLRRHAGRRRARAQRLDARRNGNCRFIADRPSHGGARLRLFPRRRRNPARPLRTLGWTAGACRRLDGRRRQSRRPRFLSRHPSDARRAPGCARVTTAICRFNTPRRLRSTKRSRTIRPPARWSIGSTRSSRGAFASRREPLAHV